MSIAYASLLGFVGAQVATPGPANMVMLATGARFGFRATVPFVFGVALSKQFIIWPIGFGMMAVMQSTPILFEILKWLSAAYIFWLAWRVANMRLSVGQATGTAPSFFAGLGVHPLNPKAWGVVAATFTNFASPELSALSNTALIASVLLGWQLLLHPVWAFSGEKIAATVAGTPREKYLMWGLAALTVLSVLYVLLGGYIS